MTSADLCQSLRDSLSSLFECAPAPDEGVRVQTPLMYPDGGMVDVFILERSGRFILTDYAEAVSWLSMQSVGGRLTPNQRRLMDDACQTLGVELVRGELRIDCPNTENLGEAVHRLGQAVVRVSDLWFTFRTRTAKSVSDEVNDWLIQREICFDRAVKLSGRSGREWRIDYQTYVVSQTSLIFLLSTGSRAAAARLAEHAAAGWADLSHLKSGQPHPAFISLFDDTTEVWLPEDFRLVGNLSEVARWSHSDRLAELLKAV